MRPHLVGSWGRRRQYNRRRGSRDGRAVARERNGSEAVSVMIAARDSGSEDAGYRVGDVAIARLFAQRAASLSIFDFLFSVPLAARASASRHGLCGGTASRAPPNLLL